ncbi:MAG: hypothetical protein CMM55_17165 [Rhodospirillaceae bacterium]|jgi:uncharacterized OB-fold protein|nr:hypothetical protein [Rhodospirillaceae bacterium]|tara:strand:+ start:127 stop:528 length:402 start_codon:yes stop_codon:yes gene_type:complete
MALPPLPRPYQDTETYWAAARDHRFVIQHCKSCGKHQFYPRGVCSHCLSSDLEWHEASGKGTVYSFSVNHRAPHPGFADEIPFVLAIVELEEGPRMMTNIVECNPDSVKIGMAVEVTFEDVTEEVTLPKFKVV